MLLRFFTHWQNSYRGIPRTIWFLSLVSFVNRSGAMVIAFMTIYLTQHLGYGIKEAGYVLGWFGLGALAGSYLGGWLTDRLGYYKVQFWSLVFNGLMLMLLMLVTQFWLMCAAMFLLSVISELFRPANSVAIARYSDPASRTRSISLFRMAVNLGWTVAPALGGLLAALGWHWLFWADGLTCLLAAGIMHWLIPARLEGDTVTVEVDKNAKSARPAFAPALLRNRQLLAFLVLTIVNAMIFMQFLWTVPLFFKKVYHWPEAQIGVMTALNGLVVFLVEMPLVFRLEGRKTPFTYVRIGLVLYGLAYLSLILPGAYLPALAYLIIISFGEIFVMPFSFNYMLSRSAGANQGKYMAFYTMTWSVANIIAPLLGTQVIDAWGFGALWVLLGVLAAMSWVGFLVLEKREQRENEAPKATEEELEAELEQAF